MNYVNHFSTVTGKGNMLKTLLNYAAADVNNVRGQLTLEAGQPNYRIAVSGSEYAAVQRRQQKIKEYEQQFKMTFDKFLKQWNEGLIEDTYETNHWANLLRRE